MTTIRAVQQDDLDTIREWTVQDGWMESANTMTSCFLSDPNGWFAAEDTHGKIIGCIAGCRLDGATVAVGTFIVHKYFRQQGVGKKLWNAMAVYAGERNLSLNVTHDRLPMYYSLGIKHEAFEIYSMVGNVNKSHPTTDRHLNNDLEIVSYVPDLFQELLKYDTAIHTIKRDVFLQQWLSPDVTTCFIVRSSGRVIGYGCVQSVDICPYIGPVFADSQQAAEVLFDKLLSQLPDNSKVAALLPQEHAVTSCLIQKHNFTFGDPGLRVYSKEIHELPLDKIYAFTSASVVLA